MYSTPSDPLFNGFILVCPNLGNDEGKPPQAVLDMAIEKYREDPASELFDFPMNSASYLTEYYEDPLQYKGKVLVGTFLSIYEIAKDNQAFASEVYAPLLMTIGSRDNLCSFPMQLQFFNNIKTHADRKMISIYDAEHHILSDGHIYK